MVLSDEGEVTSHHYPEEPLHIEGEYIMFH